VTTRWAVGVTREPSPRPSSRSASTSLPRVVALPEALSALQLRSGLATEFAHWLRAHYEGAITIAACNGTVSVLQAWGLLAATPSSPLEQHAKPLLEDSGGIVTAQGRDAWLYVGLRLVHRVYGSEVMNDTAKDFALCHRDAVIAGLHHFAPDFSHDDFAVLRAQRWLHSNVAIGTGLEVLCRVAGLHPRTLQRRFVKSTGLSPIEYAQRVRVAHAQRLILLGVRIRDVHYRVGYADPSAFRRIFCRISGCSPSNYARVALRDFQLG